MNKATHLKVISRQGVSRNEGDVAVAARKVVSEQKILPSLRIGEVVGRHKIIKRIGRGSIGDVYLCEDIELPDLRVALKVLAPHRIITPELKKRFKNEIAASARVNHQNVIRPYEFIQKRDFLAYTMEYVRGGDLSRWMTDHKEFNVRSALKILLQICTGVQAIHDAGIIHRDLKPQNILISDREEVRISDFAVSRTSDFERVTLRGRLVGTIDYLSPQYLEHGTVTSSCDIYAIGAIAFEMLTHRAPLTGNGLYETLALKLSREAPHVHELNPDCPLILSAIISKALRRSPEERYASAKEMSVDIQRVLEDETETSIIKVQSLAESLETPGLLSNLGEDIVGRSLSELYPLVPVEPTASDSVTEHCSKEQNNRRSLSAIGFFGGFAAAVAIAVAVALQHAPLNAGAVAETAAPILPVSNIYVASEPQYSIDVDLVTVSTSSPAPSDFGPRHALFEAPLGVEFEPPTESSMILPSVGSVIPVLFQPSSEVETIQKQVPRTRRSRPRISRAERQRIAAFQNTVSASRGIPAANSKVVVADKITGSPVQPAAVVTHGTVVNPAVVVRELDQSDPKTSSKKRIKIFSRSH